MLDETKELVLGYVNRIKYESYEEFKTSIFSEVYEKAMQYTGKIIEENREERQKEEINNIISFIGDRGMGKSSAMLSYFEFLENYNKINKENVEYKFADDADLWFYCLPKIDVAMLVKGENLLDIVLANMWREFEKEQPLQDETDEVRQSFIHVKRSYEMYMDSVMNSEKKSAASIRELKDLSRCLNLSNDFKKLVQKFLKLVAGNRQKHSFMVITLDDLDTATANVYEVLEQLRLFLVIPGIIVLVSADMGRLRLECNKYFLDKLRVTEILEQETIQIRGYADKYLSKLFPTNRRIYMPEMNMEIARKFKIKFGDEEEPRSFKRLFYTYIYKYTHIMLFPKKRVNSILQYNSLRNIVNELYLLEEINHSENEQNRYERIIQWLLIEMEDSLQNIQDIDEFNCLKNAINTALDSLNNELSALRGNSDFGFKRNSRRLRKDFTFAYELMVDNLYNFSNTYGMSGKVVDFVSFLYSIRLSELKEKLPVKNIWRAALVAEENMEVNKVQSDAFIIWFGSGHGNEYKDFGDWLNENADTVYGVFCTALLCDINLWNQQEADYVKYEMNNRDEQENLVFPDWIDDVDDEDNGNDVRKWTLYFETAVQTVDVSIDCYFSNMIRYKECFEGFVANLQEAYKNYIFFQGDELGLSYGEVDFIEFPIKQYIDWKDQYIIKSLYNLLPLESVDVINEITIMIYTLSPLAGNENMTYKEIEKVSRQVSKIIDVLKAVDDYYGTEYHECIEAYESQTKVLQNALRNAKENA